MSVLLWDSFLLFGRVLAFIPKILRAVVAFKIEAGFRENCAVFIQLLFIAWALYPVPVLFRYLLVGIPNILYSSHCHKVYQHYSSSECEQYSWNYNSYFWLFVYTSLWLPNLWGRLHGDISLPLMALSFDNFGWPLFLRYLDRCWRTDGRM